MWLDLCNSAWRKRLHPDGAYSIVQTVSRGLQVDEGTSAIERMLVMMTELRNLRNWNASVPADVLNTIDVASSASERHSGIGETNAPKSVSVNFTVIEGGYLNNVAAESCTANVDIRMPAGVSVKQITDEDSIADKQLVAASMLPPKP